MESSKLKNLVLLILIITNLLLGLLMLIQGMTSRQRQAQLLLDAVALLEERGIAVDPDIIPRADFPPSMTLERDSDWELEMFSGLLGESTTATQRGLVSYYTGELGRSEAREDGSFTAAFRTVKDSQQAAYGTGSLDQRTHGLDVLKRMGLEAMVVGEDEDTLEVVQLWNGKPVFSCTATLTYEFGSPAFPQRRPPKRSLFPSPRCCFASARALSTPATPAPPSSRPPRAMSSPPAPPELPASPPSCVWKRTPTSIWWTLSPAPSAGADSPKGTKPPPESIFREAVFIESLFDFS